MKERLAIFLCVLLSLAWIIANPKEAPTLPVMIIESFGTIPASERILPEDTIRFYLPDSVGYSKSIEVINPFYKKRQ